MVPITLVGIGGFGGYYLGHLLDEGGRPGGTLVAAVDPAPERSPRHQDLIDRGIPIYPSLDAAIAAGVPGRAQDGLCILSTPTPTHAPLTEQALAAGWNVLCEKPLAATVADAARMEQAEAAAAGFVAIGYQWSYGSTMARLKADLASGRFGAPKQLQGLVHWPRNRAYYDRSPWAGARSLADGTPVNDSPVANATAHFLFNMQWLLGNGPAEAAPITDIDARLFRANEIGNFDACVLTGHIAGASVTYACSHTVPVEMGPLFRYVCEQAQITYDAQNGGTVQAATSSGDTIDYGDPFGEPAAKIDRCIAVIASGDRSTLPCGIAAAKAHTAVVEELAGLPIHGVPADLVQRGTYRDSPLTWVTGQATAQVASVLSGRLPTV
jgi:predicted dehydrogenase